MEEPNTIIIDVEEATGKITRVQMKLAVYTFKEKEFFISYIPSLNLTCHNKDKAKSIKGLNDAVELFVKFWGGNGKLTNKLSVLNWKLIDETTISIGKKGNKSQFIPDIYRMSIPFGVLNAKAKLSNISFNIPMTKKSKKVA